MFDKMVLFIFTAIVLCYGLMVTPFGVYFIMKKWEKATTETVQKWYVIGLLSVIIVMFCGAYLGILD